MIGARAADGRGEDSIFLRMVETMLPEGGIGMVQVEAYFDESGSHRGAPILCVAGYLFDSREVPKFVQEWNAVLRAFNLPFFRMSACAHGAEPFNKLSKPDRIIVASEMIRIIKKRSIRGIAVTVNEKQFRQHINGYYLIGGSYSFLVNSLLAGVGEWIDANPFVKRVAYFFEAGHASQSEANRIMSEIFKPPELQAAYRYGGHAFVEKTQTSAIQAADLLAWQWYTDRRHQLEARPRRKDFISLLEHPHHALHMTEDRLSYLAMDLPPIMGDPPHQIVGRSLSDKTSA